MLCSCAPWSMSNVKKTDGSKAIVASERGQKSPDDILVIETDIGDRDYKILGDIEVTLNKYTVFNRDPTIEEVKQKLREEAAKLGADAVILVRYGTAGLSFWSWGALNGKGRAIVFLD